MSRAVSLAALLLASQGSLASAADLEAMSSHGKRIYCVAYSLIDVRMRYDSGAIDKAAYDRERVQLAWKIQNRGDNFNYAGDFRRLDAAIDAIVKERPPMHQFAAQVRECHSYLRL
jgi:hypothetical protein